MKKSLANQIAKLWNENHVGSYEPTKTQAIVRKSAINGDYSVEVRPVGEENNGQTTGTAFIVLKHWQTSREHSKYLRT